MTRHDPPRVQQQPSMVQQQPPVVQYEFPKRVGRKEEDKGAGYMGGGKRNNFEIGDWLEDKRQKEMEEERLQNQGVELVNIWGGGKAEGIWGIS